MFCTYFSCNFPVAIKWNPRKNGSYVLKNDQIALLHRAFPFVIGNASAYSKQITLLGDMQLGMNPFNQNGSVPYSCLYFFFKYSFSIFMAPRVFSASSY